MTYKTCYLICHLSFRFQTLTWFKQMVLNVAWCCIILVIHVLGMNAIFWFFIWNHLGILHYTCYAQLDCKTNVNGVRDFTLYIFSQFDLIKYIFISNNHNISFEVLCAVSLISSLLFNYRSLILSKQTHTFSLIPMLNMVRARYPVN